LPVKGLAIKWPSCELFDDGWTIDRANPSRGDRRTLMQARSTSSIRLRVDPRDVPADKAARRLGLTLAAFEDVKDRLFARGFPRPDLDTGLFDLKAIDDWMDRRSGLTSNLVARDASTVVKARLEAMRGGKAR
jgi:hypothetical protein